MTERHDETGGQGRAGRQESPLQRATDILVEARQDAERILRDADRRATEVLRESPAEAPSEAVTRTVRELLAEVRQLAAALEGERTQLRRQIDAIRSLLEVCRQGIEELRSDAGVRPSAAPSSPAQASAGAPAGGEPAEGAPVADGASREAEVPAPDTLDPQGGYVHLFINNVDAFSQLMDVYEALAASPDIRDVAISRYQGRQSHVLLNLERPVRAADIGRVLEAAGQKVQVEDVDAGLLTLRISLAG